MTGEPRPGSQIPQPIGGFGSKDDDEGHLWATVLSVVLADSEIEPVPEALHDHSTVVDPAERRGLDPERMLLDSSMHHWAMDEIELPGRDRRGRPDLAHLFLLNALDSVLNLEGGLRAHVHTRNDEHIRIDPATRLPRAYPRFKGLVGKLFAKGEVGPADRDPLMALSKPAPLAAVLDRIEPDHTIALDPAGTMVEPAEALAWQAGEHDDLCVIFGGFPHGDYASSVDKLADERWSIHTDPLSVWAAASEILVHWRHVTQGMSVHRGPKPER